MYSIKIYFSVLKIRKSKCSKYISFIHFSLPKISKLYNSRIATSNYEGTEQTAQCIENMQKSFKLKPLKYNFFFHAILFFDKNIFWLTLFSKHKKLSKKTFHTKFYQLYIKIIRFQNFMNHFVNYAASATLVYNVCVFIRSCKGITSASFILNQSISNLGTCVSYVKKYFYNIDKHFQIY